MNQDLSNLHVLESDSINAYLDHLEFSLDLLSRKLTELGYPEVSRYCTEIIATCRCFRYSRGDEGEGIDARLRIDPVNSGMPNTVEFMRLQGEKVQADRLLKDIPVFGLLARDALEKVYQGLFPAQEHGLAIKRSYYESVLRSPIARKFEVAAVTKEKARGDRRCYRIDWRGLDETKNLFIYYSMLVEQDIRSKSLQRCGADHKVYRLIEEKFGHGPRLVFLGIEDLRDIHPLHVWRWILGPYYSSVTRNPDPVNTLFEAVEDPFIMRFRREEVKREGSLRLRGGKGKKSDRELASPLTTEEYLIAPFAIREELAALFSVEERSFTIFGATEEGELVH
ncbi:hypothetical protein ACFLU6_09110 [Acidobacteriota bacterium]